MRQLFCLVAVMIFAVGCNFTTSNVTQTMTNCPNATQTASANSESEDGGTALREVRLPGINVTLNSPGAVQTVDGEAPATQPAEEDE